MKILILTKRQYMNKDLIDDRFGRFREIPLALAERGHTVTGLCLSYRKRTEGWIADGPVNWKSINAGPSKASGLFRFIMAARRLAARSDVIWACSDSFYGIIGCFLGRIHRCPVVFDIYDNFGEFFVGRLPVVRQLYHWAIRHSDAVTCLSSAFADYLAAEFPRQSRIYPIEFAVRSDLFKPMDRKHCREVMGLPVSATIIGACGALYKNRNIFVLIEAFTQLRHRYPGLHLALAGPRDAVFPDDPAICDCGILPHETVPVFLNALDIGVICYPNDAFGRYCFPQKTREFMACDVPIIASAVGSLKDLLKEHPEWLYDPEDAVQLASRIEQRLTDRETDYDPPTTWTDLAVRLETILQAVTADQPPCPSPSM
ncbi:MAG: glycosyltransferase [Thermodesulfobacteriota bacterium]